MGGTVTHLGHPGLSQFSGFFGSQNLIPFGYMPFSFAAYGLLEKPHPTSNLSASSHLISSLPGAALEVGLKPNHTVRREEPQVGFLRKQPSHSSGEAE